MLAAGLDLPDISGTSPGSSATPSSQVVTLRGSSVGSAGAARPRSRLAAGGAESGAAGAAGARLVQLAVGAATQARRRDAGASGGGRGGTGAEGPGEGPAAEGEEEETGYSSGSGSDGGWYTEEEPTEEDLAAAAAAAAARAGSGTERRGRARAAAAAGAAGGRERGEAAAEGEAQGESLVVSVRVGGRQRGPGSGREVRMSLSPTKPAAAAERSPSPPAAPVLVLAPPPGIGPASAAPAPGPAEHAPKRASLGPMSRALQGALQQAAQSRVASTARPAGGQQQQQQQQQQQPEEEGEQGESATVSPAAPLPPPGLRQGRRLQSEPATDCEEVEGAKEVAGAGKTPEQALAWRQERILQVGVRGAPASSCLSACAPAWGLDSAPRLSNAVCTPRQLPNFPPSSALCSESLNWSASWASPPVLAPARRAPQPAGQHGGAGHPSCCTSRPAPPGAQRRRWGQRRWSTGMESSDEVPIVEWGSWAPSERAVLFSVGVQGRATPGARRACFVTGGTVSVAYALRDAFWLTLWGLLSEQCRVPCGFVIWWVGGSGAAAGGAWWGLLLKGFSRLLTIVFDM